MIDSYRGTLGIRIQPNPDSLGVWLNIQDTDRETPLFYLKKYGALHVNLTPIARHLEKAGLDSKTLSTFGAEVRRILRMPISRNAPTRSIIEINVPEFKAAVDAFIAEVQAADREE